MSKIITVSVTEIHDLWLKKHKFDKSCSPSFLLRCAINQKMQEFGDVLEDYKSLRKQNETLMNNLTLAVSKLNKADGNLLEEYITESRLTQ